MKQTLEKSIIELRNQGLSYKQISEKLNCSKGTICFHLCNGQKNKSKLRTRKYRSKQHPFQKKIENFIYNEQINNYKPLRVSKTTIAKIRQKIKQFSIIGTHKMSKQQSMLFSPQDVIDKFGPNFKCYLTGESINIDDTDSYHFDHVIPRSRGGDNTIDNLGICTKQANQSKHDMTLDEYLIHCQKVLENHNFIVNKK